MDRLQSAPLAAGASAALGFGALFVALAMSPWFVWRQDALSDLGHPSHTSAALFGAGLAAAGALYQVFVWAIAPAAPATPLGRAALFSLAFGGLSLSAIGILNESYGAVHLLVSVTYFTFVPVGMLLLALSLKGADSKLPSATIALSIAAALLGLSVAGAQEFAWPFPSQAIPELLASLLLGLWSVAAAFWVASGRLSAASAPGSTPPRRPSA